MTQRMRSGSALDPHGDTLRPPADDDVPRRRSRRPHSTSGVHPAPRVADTMSWPALVVAADFQVAHVSKLADVSGYRHFPVLESGRLVGVVCTCDLWRTTPHASVRTCMSSDPISIAAHATLYEALELMNELEVDCLPCLWSNAWGIVTRGDLGRMGLFDERDRPRCNACSSTHHVRDDGDRVLCLVCRAIDDDLAALYLDLGDAG